MDSFSPQVAEDKLIHVGLKLKISDFFFSFEGCLKVFKLTCGGLCTIKYMPVEGTIWQNNVSKVCHFITLATTLSLNFSILFPVKSF